MVIGGINEDGTETNSVEVLPLDGGFLLACEKHWPVPKTIVQGVGGSIMENCLLFVLQSKIFSQLIT